MFKQILSAAACLGLLFAAAPAKAEGQKPESLSSLSAVLYEPESGRVLYEKDAHTPRPMASTTKLMTALLAMENAAPDQNVVVTREAILVEGSALGLREGDNISMLDLVTGLLLESGNDAANTIALTVSGSLPAFAEKMNQKAKELGMKDSVFVTPSGLDQGGHSSSAYDMALLGAAVMRNPALAAICAKKSAVIELGNPKHKATVVNHNKLLNLYPYAVGMKTGFTKKAGRCLVSAAEKDGVRLICVTLNCPDDWNTHAALYQRYFALTESRPLTLEAPILPVVGGQKAALQTVLVGQPTYTAIRGREEGITVTVYLNRGFCYAPVEADQPLGQVVWRRGDHVIGTAVLAAGESIPALESHRPWWQKLYG